MSEHLTGVIEVESVCMGNLGGELFHGAHF